MEVLISTSIGKIMSRILVMMRWLIFCAQTAWKTDLEIQICIKIFHKSRSCKDDGIPASLRSIISPSLL